MAYKRGGQGRQVVITEGPGPEVDDGDDDEDDDEDDDDEDDDGDECESCGSRYGNTDCVVCFWRSEEWRGGQGRLFW